MEMAVEPPGLGDVADQAEAVQIEELILAEMEGAG